MAFTLILLAVSALSPIVLTRSPQVDAVAQARDVLLKKYGLTHSALGNFTAVYTGWQQTEGNLRLRLPAPLNGGRMHRGS